MAKVPCDPAQVVVNHASFRVQLTAVPTTRSPRLARQLSAYVAASRPAPGTGGGTGRRRPVVWTGGSAPGARSLLQAVRDNARTTEPPFSGTRHSPGPEGTGGARVLPRHGQGRGGQAEAQAPVVNSPRQPLAQENLLPHMREADSGYVNSGYENAGYPHDRHGAYAGAAPAESEHAENAYARPGAPAWEAGTRLVESERRETAEPRSRRATETGGRAGTPGAPEVAPQDGTFGGATLQGADLFDTSAEDTGLGNRTAGATVPTVVTPHPVADVPRSRSEGLVGSPLFCPDEDTAEQLPYTEGLFVDDDTFVLERIVDPAAAPPGTGHDTSAQRRGARPVRHAYYPGRRMNLGVVLLPLRVFLGLISVYAGMGKLCDPVYFDGGERGSMVKWLQSLDPWPLAEPLRDFALHHPVGAGLTIAFLQVFVGVLTILGLWQRFAAAIGALLSAALLVTVSWRTVPAYDAPDIIYLAAWSPLIIAGAPVYSADGRLSSEAWRTLGPRAELWDLRRRVLRRGALLATFTVGLTMLVGALLGGAVRDADRVTVPGPGETPRNELPGSPVPQESRKKPQNKESSGPDEAEEAQPEASAADPTENTEGSADEATQPSGADEPEQAPQPEAPPPVPPADGSGSSDPGTGTSTGGTDGSADDGSGSGSGSGGGGDSGSGESGSLVGGLLG
ncbi:DoxX family protein [Streptomyces sp. NA04227]|nr:DoxX family protein [Streptomyces sp. NA04227]